MTKFDNKKYTSRCPKCKMLENHRIPPGHQAKKPGELKRLNNRREEREKEQQAKKSEEAQTSEEKNTKE